MKNDSGSTLLDLMSSYASRNMYFNFEHLLSIIQVQEKNTDILKDLEIEVDKFIDENKIDRSLVMSWSREQKNVALANFVDKMDSQGVRGKMIKVREEAREFADEIIEYIEYHRNKKMSPETVLSIVTQESDAKDPKLKFLIKRYQKRSSHVDQLWRNLISLHVKKHIEELAYQ